MLTDYAAAGDTELWNTARLAAYLVAAGSPLDSGPEICRCPTLTAELLGDAPYTTPDAGAPWYDPDVPQSGEFLGFLPLSVAGVDDNPRARSVSGAVGGGGVFGPAQDLPRTMTVTGVLLGTTCCGVDYGLHYLSEVLNSCAGGGCDGGCLSMYACCPEEGMSKAEFDARHRRTFMRTALVSGPTVTQRRGTGGGSCATGGCTGADLVEVEFVLVAGVPWAWTDPEPRLDVTFPVTGEGDCVEWCLDAVDGVCEGEPCLFQDCAPDSRCDDPLAPVVSVPQPGIPRSAFCVPLVPERACYTIDLSTRSRWSEDVPVVTVNAGVGPLRNVAVVIYENPDPAVPCDQGADLVLCNPVNSFYISYVPPGGSVTLDGRTGQATLSCTGTCEPASTVYGDSDGSPLRFEGLDCASYCVCVEADPNFPPSPDASVSVEISGKGL